MVETTQHPVDAKPLKQPLTQWEKVHKLAEDTKRSLRECWKAFKSVNGDSLKAKDLLRREENAH